MTGTRMRHASVCVALLALGCSATALAAPEFTAWRKPGLWEVRIWPQGKGVMHSTRVLQCSTPEVEPTTMLSIVPGQEHCKTKVTPTGAKKLRVSTQCEVHEQPFAADIEILGDRTQSYEGSFHVRAENLTSPARMQFSGQWLGPCEAPLKPGEMQLPNGARVDTVRDRASREAAHQH